MLKAKFEQLKHNSELLKTNSSKIVVINQSVKSEKSEQKLEILLSNETESPLYRIEKFFELLFQQKIIPFSCVAEFKQWQMKLANIILEGQRSFLFVNTFSPMELSEVLLAGFKGMIVQCEQRINNNFFEIWMKTNRRILLA